MSVSAYLLVFLQLLFLLRWLRRHSELVGSAGSLTCQRGQCIVKFWDNVLNASAKPLQTAWAFTMHANSEGGAPCLVQMHEI